MKLRPDTIAYWACWGAILAAIVMIAVAVFS